MLRFTWISAVKDLRRLRRDPFSVAAWLGIPVVLAVLMSLLFGRGDTAPQGRLLVADQDGTIVSSVLTSAFDREPLSKMVLVEKVGAVEGRARIDRDEGSALLIVPKGLQNAYLRNQPVRLQLFTNPSQRILPKIIEETLSIMLDAGFYVREFAGDQLRAFDPDRAPSDAAILQSSVAMTQTMTKVRRFLDPPLIGLETTVVDDQPKDNKPAKNFASLFLPSMIFMSLLFIANGLASEVWKERALGTLRRLAVTPAPLAAFLAGRLLVVALVLSGVAVVGLAAMHQLANLPVSNLPAAALWLVFAGTALFLLLLLPILYATSQRAASMLGNLVILPLAMIGGCFMPFDGMPPGMAAIGRLTPNGWALVEFNAILEGSARLPHLAAAVAGLVAVSAVAFAIAMRRLRRGFLL